jgi:uroporphyrinogen-III decarboxylase
MTARERFLSVLNGKMPDDRFPMIEWAAWWWDTTIARWISEGMPPDLDFARSQQYFGLDEMHCVGCSPRTPPALGHGLGVIQDEEDYERLKKDMYPDSAIEGIVNAAKNLKPRHDNGEIVIRVWLDGFFWFPRRLFGIEPHMYAFYDYPELMERITQDLCEFNMKALKELFKVMKPDFVGYAEDMSYNHGPMISKECFDRFMLPHYIVMNDFVHENGVKTLVDSDGDVTVMIPWFEKSGIDGVYPLERQAGVDITKIREEYPRFIMLGGYDKMVMNKGEEAIRGEFERLLPVMRSGYFIPSVDHQTPPGVSFEDYKIYIKLFREYCEKAVK